MKRVLLDTSIYGKIIEKGDEVLIIKSIEGNILKGKLVIYGNNLVRKELRDTPRRVKVKKIGLRNLLLTLFDGLVQKHSFNITSEMRKLAKDYFKVYKEIGGLRKEKDIINDFIIVASATLKKLDIIYSEDNKTMMSDKAIKAYSIVNEIKRLRMPNFEGYNEFIREIRRLLI